MIESAGSLESAQIGRYHANMNMKQAQRGEKPAQDQPDPPELPHPQPPASLRVDPDGLALVQTTLRRALRLDSPPPTRGMPEIHRLRRQGMSAWIEEELSTALIEATSRASLQDLRAQDALIHALIDGVRELLGGEPPWGWTPPPVELHSNKPSPINPNSSQESKSSQKPNSNQYQSDDAWLSWRDQGSHVAGDPTQHDAQLDVILYDDLSALMKRKLEAILSQHLGTWLNSDKESAQSRGALFQDTLQSLHTLGEAIAEALGAVEAQILALYHKRRWVCASGTTVARSSLPKALASRLSDIAASDEGDDPRLLSLDALSASQRDEVEGALASDAGDGLLIHGDNLDAMRLLRPRYADRVRCAYMDPPFNTTGQGFGYRDRWNHSTWLTMIDERIATLRPLLTQDGTLYAHIDYAEKERLRLLLDRHLCYVTEIIWRIGWVSGFKTKAHKFIRNHDTIYQYGRTGRPHFNKTWLPYPPDYRRRDGKPPTGKGVPLEDTWNCSETDPLHSIQIMSFSREKIGDGKLTQKNENLLERMILASSDPDDLILDPFAGTGTTAAAAGKLGRRWIGIEAGPHFDSVALPRAKRVLAGDPYGISKAVNWQGGGKLRWLRLESLRQTLLACWDPDNVGPCPPPTWLHYRLRSRDRAPTLHPSSIDDPFSCQLALRENDEWTGMPIDPIETFNWLLGLRDIRRLTIDKREALVVGITPEGARALIVWRLGTPGTSGEPLSNAIGQRILKLAPEGIDRAWINGGVPIACPPLDGRPSHLDPVEPKLAALMFPPLA